MGADACSVPNIIAASVAISLVGFFSGPLFATVSHSTLSINTQILTCHTGHFCRITIVRKRYQIDRSITDICICSNRWIFLPDRYRLGQFEQGC